MLSMNVLGWTKPLLEGVLGGYVRMFLALVVVLLFPLGYLKGCSDERKHFVRYQAQVEAIGELHAVRVARVMIEQQRITKEVTNELRAKVEALDADNRLLADRLRAALARARIVPGPRKPAAGNKDPSRVCFDGPKLDQRIREGLRELSESLGESIHRGAGGLIALGACIDVIDSQPQWGKQ